jgi:uncharacterized C2H2 Zn-finger protein
MSIINLKNIELNNIINLNNSILTIKELLNKINYNLDNLYIDRFWNSIQDDKWIYLDNDLILWLDYKDIKIGKEKIIKFLKLHFKDFEDYKILNNSQFNINNFCFTGVVEQNINEEKRGAHNKQYITVSPDCFKELCMYVGTSKSKEIKKYYIELEKVFKFYLEYQNKYRELELEKNKKELENKNQELEEKDNIINKQKDKIMDMEVEFEFTKLESNEFIYIATNNTYHKQNVYKIGRSGRLNKRTKQFNTFFVNGHKMQYIYIYQCHNSKILEQLLFTCLSNYRYCKINELFNIKLDKLLYLIENINIKYTDIINFTNKICLDPLFNEKILNKDNEFPSGQIYPINHTNLNNSEFDLLKLQKYVNNKNICNIIIKEYKEFDFENEILKNNKALSLEEETNYYFLQYNNKIVYICTNCGALKKDRRSYVQHINKRNKCDKENFILNTIEDINNHIKKMNIQFYECKKCIAIFKTKDHYIRHLKSNCKN